MKHIDRFEIVNDLMETGFSDLFIGKDTADGSDVAVKVFHPKRGNVGAEAQYGPDFWRERFIEEGRILSRLNHPHIVHVVAQGTTEEGEPYFVMPFMEANLLYEIGADAKTEADIEDIEPKWRPRSLSPRRAVDIWSQVLAGLSELHDQGLVHRDIKPPNVLLTSKVNGTVKLGDFGMVKVPNAKGSRSGIWIGTLDYISPEQRRSAAEVDARADVYSVGVLMYRMLTGKLLHKGRPPLRGQRVGVPQAVADLVEHCLQKRRRDRPANAGAVLASLNAFVPDVKVLSERNRLVRRAKAITIKPKIRPREK